MREVHDFLELSENHNYLNRNNLVVTCYDDAMTVQFENLLSHACLTLQDVQSSYEAQTLNQAEQMQALGAMRSASGRGWLSSWCCLFASADSNDEEQNLLSNATRTSYGPN